VDYISTYPAPKKNREKEKGKAKRNKSVAFNVVVK
jgi:hypothetical protein